MPERPLSPHLSVYKFKYTLATSIFNRFAGARALAAGLLLLVYWLMALGRGRACLRAGAQLAVARGIAEAHLRALIAAFFYHLVAGIRHLVWDTGRGLERAQSHSECLVVGWSALVAP